MLASLFNGLKARRPSAPRPSSRSFRPTSESMEDRRLLSANPLMIISNETVVEGTGGVTPMNFTVSISSSSSKAISVNYQTINQSAQAGSDYIATSGRLTFNPGETEKTLTVNVIGDDKVEPTEAFYIALSNASNARVIKPLGVGVILDDDAAVEAELSINNVSMTRGLSGHKFMTFTISLNTTVDTPVSVTASTRNVTAKAGVDYTTKAETLTFAPGQTTKEFKVKIHSTSKPTSDKLVYIDLKNSSVALKVKTGVGILRYGA